MKVTAFYMYQICFQPYPNVVIAALFLYDVLVILKINTYTLYMQCTDCICSCTYIMLAIIL